MHEFAVGVYTNLVVCVCTLYHHKVYLAHVLSPFSRRSYIYPYLDFIRWTLDGILVESLVPQLKKFLPWLIDEYQYPFQFPLLDRDGTQGGEKPFREMSPWSETLSDLKTENKNKLRKIVMLLIFQVSFMHVIHACNVDV